eukprot:1716981-Rhodomonas_salina.1
MPAPAGIDAFPGPTLSSREPCSLVFPPASPLVLSPSSCLVLHSLASALACSNSWQHRCQTQTLQCECIGCSEQGYLLHVFYPSSVGPHPLSFLTPTLLCSFVSLLRPPFP